MPFLKQFILVEGTYKQYFLLTFRVLFEAGSPVSQVWFEHTTWLKMTLNFYFCYRYLSGASLQTCTSLCVKEINKGFWACLVDTQPPRSKHSNFVGSEVQDKVSLCNSSLVVLELALQTRLPGKRRYAILCLLSG